VRVVNASGGAGDPLVLEIDPDAVALAPDTTLVNVTIDSPGALNAPLTLPIALRKLSDLVITDDADEPTDSDGDGIADTDDNCVDTANTDQADGDGFGDVCDPFPTCANCGPLGLVGYLGFASAYGSVLALRRRTRP